MIGRIIYAADHDIHRLSKAIQACLNRTCSATYGLTLDGVNFFSL
jgi:hypothetical protein